MNDFGCMAMALVLPLVAGCGSSGGPSDTSSTSSSGSGGTPDTTDDGSCADCGRCGIAGINGQDFAVIEDVGTDTDGDAAVGLRHEKKDTCTGESQLRFVLTFADGVAELAKANGRPAITTSTVTYASKSYTWNDRDLAMSFEREGSSVVLTFTGGEATTDVRCTATSETISCE